MSPATALRAAAAALLIGAALHVAALLAGPGWIAFLGAPPSIVVSAERGSWQAPTGTLMIASLLCALAAYCLAAAQKRRLPLQRSVLALAAVLFILRGVLVFPVLLFGTQAWSTPLGGIVVTGPLPVFLVGSAIVLVTGLLIAAGLARSRPAPLCTNATATRKGAAWPPS